MTHVEGPGAELRVTEAILPARRGRLRALVTLGRPRQWLKNALVIAAPGAAGALGREGVPARVLAASVAFCLISAGIYALNDIADRHEDRLHPRKCRRPVAAGRLTVAAAATAGSVWLATGLVVCAAVSPALLAVAAGYIALTVTYSWVWRHIPVLDLVALAGGFVLRAVAGGAAAPVGLSGWFITVVSATAVFVAAGKRLCELRRAGSSTPVRRVLRRYGARSLRLTALGAQAVAIGAYGLWVFLGADLRDAPWRLLTVVPFVACLLRYGQLIGRGAAEAPEDALLRDRRLSLATVSWMVLFALSVNVTA